MPDLFREVLYAIRSLRRSAGYAAVTILTLAIAVGATTTVIGVVERALLRPLPFDDSHELVTLLESNSEQGLRLASYPTFLDWQEQSQSFAGLSFVRGNTGILRNDDGAEQLLIGYVSPGHFSVMDAQPLLGRTFGAEEEQSDIGSPVVLSHEFWLRRFGGDPSVIGRTLSLDIGTLAVIGVMPAGTTYPAWADVWRPIAAVAATDPGLSNRAVRSDSRVVARLRDGVTADAAAAEMRAIATRIAETYADDARGWTAVQLTPLRDAVIGNVAPMLLTLGAAVVLGLLIACVNVANLALVRAAARTRDVAVRAALGAGRARIARQLLAESLVLATAAGALGVLITYWATAALRGAAPPGLPRAAELVVDARILAGAVLLSLLTATLCGLAPAIHLLRTDLAGALREGRAGGLRSRGGRRVQAALTVGQFALALMLLIGAGLLVQSFRKVQAVDVGFSPEGVLALRVLPPTPRYDSAPAVAALYSQLMERAGAVAGVEAVAIVNHAPLSNAGIPTRVRVPGRTMDTTGADAALYKTVSTEYQRVMRLPLLQGRWFTDADMTGAATGVVVSEQMATRYWPEQRAIGQTITVFKSSQARADFGAPVSAEVIGVVGSVRHFGMESDPVAEVYLPYTSEPWPHAVLVVRASAPAATVIPELRRAVLSVDRDIPVAGSGQAAGIQPLERSLDSLLETRRWMMSLVSAFSVGALLLAVMGIYGVTSYVVAQRTHEMGVRKALGASRSHIVGIVLRRGVGLAAAGVVLGLAGALALTRLLEGLLFGTSPREAVVFVLLPLLLTVIAAVASYLPARRAARVDPVIALRAE